MGRPQFAQQGTRGSGDTVAVSDRPEITNVDASTSSSIASGNSEQTEIYAPTGSLYFPMAMWIRCDADADATTGNHQFIVRTSGNVKVGKGRSTYNTAINYQHQHWHTADHTQYPNDEAAQAMIPERMAATENEPITIGYYNNTDVAQENNRRRQLTMKEVTY